MHFDWKSSNLNSDLNAHNLLSIPKILIHENCYLIDLKLRVKTTHQILEERLKFIYELSIEWWMPLTFDVWIRPIWDLREPAEEVWLKKIIFWSEKNQHAFASTRDYASRANQYIFFCLNASNILDFPHTKCLAYDFREFTTECAVNFRR